MGALLNEVIIRPLYIALEAAFMLCYSIFKDCGAAIVGVSIAVSLLTLPLYIVAEKWQEVERRTQKMLEPFIERIKSVFHGDEQYMMLTALYRERHYHPLMALRSSIGLLIQIPFFIAAYSFLSRLAMLQECGLSLLGIKDLAKADAMIKVGGIAINVLPIAMTAINIAAGAIYTKGLKWKDKVPIYAMALLFLVILYRSPSGLVFYWTMNNVFSLVKNIFYKIKKPLRVLYIMLCAVVVFIDYYVLFVHEGFLYRRLMMAAAAALLIATPIAVRLCIALLHGALRPLMEDNGSCNMMFVLSAVSIALLYGVVTPSVVIASSPVEFCGIDDVASPLYFVFSSFAQCVGLIIFWPSCIYLLFGKRIRTLLAVMFAVVLFASVIDTFLFGDVGHGNLSRLMTFDAPVALPSAAVAVANTASIIASAALVLLLIAKGKARIASSAVIVALLSFVMASSIEAVKIQGAYTAYQSSHATDDEMRTIKPIYHLSRTGRNVIVIMMDRASSAYFLPIIRTIHTSDRVQLEEGFDGFTFYPNTVSYNQGTLLGAPPLYGGYGYTPLEMNKRSSEKLVDKNTEALLMMPRILSEQAAFDVTVSDLSWAGYKWIPDMSICDPYPRIRGLNTERRYSDLWVKEHPKNIRKGLTSATIRRNILYFSIFKAAPTYLRDVIYNDGSWWSSNEVVTDVMEFIDYYSVLDYLPRLTAADGKGDTFIMFANNTTHSGQELSPPDYEPTSEKVTDRGPMDRASIWGDIAMCRLLGNWFDYLKAEGVYDNTRIIIAADHGIGRSDAFELAPYKGRWNKKGYNPDHNNPLLLVKDFGKRGAIIRDNRFMTNADVPYLALEGIVDEPTNPWNGQKLEAPTQEDKVARGVVLTHVWNPGANIYTFKVPDGDWMTVKDNMFDVRNWRPMKVK